MHKFEYRAPRFRVDFPVRLSSDDATLTGRCLEISIDGMLAEFPEPLALDSSATVILPCNDQLVRIPAKVVHAGLDFCGLSFSLSTERERRSLEQVVALISAPAPKLGPVRIK